MQYQKLITDSHVLKCIDVFLVEFVTLAGVITVGTVVDGII